MKDLRNPVSDAAPTGWHKRQERFCLQDRAAGGTLQTENLPAASMLCSEGTTNFLPLTHLWPWTIQSFSLALSLLFSKADKL